MKKSALCLLLCLLLALPCLSVAEQSRQVNRSCRIYFANGTELASRLNDGRLLTEVNGAEAVEHTFYIDPFLNYTNAEKQTTHRLKGRFFHRASRIISTQRDLTLLDILDNMGFSDRSIAPLMNVAQHWQTTLLPGILAELPNVMNGHLGGLVNQAVSLSQQIFPSASTADYIDLLSWVMQHRPFPDQNNLGAWLVDATKPQEKQAPGVFDHTYSYNLDQYLRTPFPFQFQNQHLVSLK